MNKTGEWGEIYACRYLREQGVDIIGANYRTRFGEVDIIGIDKKYIIFFEVKARSPHSIATPAEFVGAEKQEKIMLASESFIAKYNIDRPVRFDVIEVYFEQENNYENYKINHIKDAFTA